jgi:hypothetical protein
VLVIVLIGVALTGASFYLDRQAPDR